MNKQFAGRPNAVHLRELSLEEVNREEVLAALSRITTSARFRNSERIRDFLRYVVEETLDGRGALIKAHSIAVDVFGRQNFSDESGEAVVRTSAHRLRLFLEGHFNDEGADDQYRIVLPKGAYVPKFYVATPTADNAPNIAEPTRERPQIEMAGKAAPASPPTDRLASFISRKYGVFLALASLLLLCAAVAAYVGLWSSTDLHRPRIVVTTTPISAGVPSGSSLNLQRRLASNLVSFGSATIIDQAYVNEQTSKEGLFNLNVSLAAANGLVADWKLIDAATGSVLWTGRENLQSATYPALDDAANSIASSVLGQEGAIAIWSGASTYEDDPRRCLSTAQIRSTLISDDSEQARRCLETLTQENPNDATAWALLSMTYYRLAVNFPWMKGEDRQYYELQRTAIARAVKLNPDTFYTKLAQLFGAHARRDREAFDDVSRRLLAQYEGYPGLRTQIAVKLAEAGRQAEAQKLIERKLAMGATLNEVDNATLMLICYFDGDYAAARPLVDRISDEETPLAVTMKVATYGQLGLKDQARKSWSALVRNYPDYPKVMNDFLARGPIPGDKAALILDGVKKAGVLHVADD